MAKPHQPAAASNALPTGWPRPLGPAARYGLLGDVVRCIEPCTEADPAALILQILATFGNVIGQKPHFTVEADYHAGNLFVLILGRTARGRKGTSWGYVQRMFEVIDPAWSRACINNGLSSGEGLVQTAAELKKRVGRRLFVLEDEFSRVLRVMTREGNTLSTTLRQAWDGKTLQVMTRRSPLRAEKVHISIVAQTTLEDLRRYMSKTDLFNGFGNRFLWGCVERAQLLPLGGDVPTEELKKLTERMKSAVEFSKRMSEVEFSSKATELWARGYQQLSADVPGALGAVTSRAEAQVRRLAIIYALMHESKRVLLQHLRAALEIWRFCRDSAEFIFVDSAGPSMEEKLMEIIPTTGLGIARTGISRVFSNHQSKEIATALKNMETLGLAKPTIVVTGGRPGE